MDFNFTQVGIFLGIVVNILAIYTIFRELRREREQRIKWEQKMSDDIQHLTDRVDTHNGYAELFAKNSEKFAVITADVAYIRGMIERSNKE